MSHYLVLFTGSFSAFLSPFIAHQFNLNLTPIILVITTLSLLLQEALVIQKNRRRENVDFTHRFNRRFPIGTNFHIRYSSSLFGVLILISLLLLSNFEINSQTIFFYMTFPLIGKLLFEPLLGSFSDYDIKTLQAMFGYVVIYAFALTSSFQPAEISFLPESITVSYTLAATLLTMLSLRMAYYEKFCFENNIELEAQLSLVLFSLFALSVPELIHAFESIVIELR